MMMDILEQVSPAQWREALLAADAQLAQACGAVIPEKGSADGQRLLAGIEWGKPIQFDAAKGWGQGIDPRLLPALAMQYAHTGQESFAQDARRIFEVVLEAEPWHAGWRPAGRFDPLVIPHRLGDTECVGWMGSLPALLASQAFDDALLMDILRSVAGQLDYLADHLNPGRNIRLSQADALLTAALRLPRMPASPRWQALGVHVLNDGFHRLIAADGASREAAAWYHFIIMNMGMRLWRLQQARPALGLTIRPATVAAMFDYTLACIEPSGRGVRIGDTTGRITPDGTLASFIARRQACLRELGLPDALPPAAQCFNEVKQAFVRTSWEPDADHLAFDATTRYGYHWHPGRNAMQLCIAGQRVLVDVGRMRYNLTPHRQYALSTRAHNTLNLNGWNQADTPADMRTLQADNWRVVEGDYQGGYWPTDGYLHDRGIRGIHARHQRTILWRQGSPERQEDLLLVIDHLAHTQGDADKPSVEILWHFAPGQVTLADGRTVHASHGDARLHLHVLLSPADATLSLHEGQMEPAVLGWMADERTDSPIASPSVMLRCPRVEPWRTDWATLLVPARGGHRPRAIAQATGHDASAGPHAHLDITWADGARDRFWWTRHLAGALDEVEPGLWTDASLLHVSLDAQGRLARVMLLDGTYARASGDGWLIAPQPSPGLHVASGG